MATLTTNNIGAPAGIRHAFETFKNALGKALISYGNRRSRVDQIQRLEALTDAELAEMGLQREEITRYVFRDLFYM